MPQTTHKCAAIKNADLEQLQLALGSAMASKTSFVVAGGPLGVFQNIPNTYPGSNLEAFAHARGFVITQNHSEVCFL